MCSSCVLPPTLYLRLASCFCFLGRVFQALRMFRGFLSCFSSLRISRSSTCFGLELFLGFLSFRLLGFPVLSSPCGVSRLTTLSLFLSVPRFLLDWMVTSSVLFGGVPPSPPVHRPSLGWPTRSISLLCLSLFGLFLGALLSEFSSFLPLVTSRLALSFCRRAPWSSLCCW